jgi:hypothetical protein
MANRIPSSLFWLSLATSKRHGSAEQGPDKKYRMELTGLDEMFFRNLEGQPKAKSNDWKLTRRK